MQRRPNTCTLRLQVSRGLVGRMMADPAFVQKLLMESIICTGSSLLWEAQQRGERFSRELDLVAINTLSLLAANVALVWCVTVFHQLAVVFVPLLCWRSPEL
jgi:Protein RETICULATA-related